LERAIQWAIRAQVNELRVIPQWMGETSLQLRHIRVGVQSSRSGASATAIDQPRSRSRRASCAPILVSRAEGVSFAPSAMEVSEAADAIRFGADACTAAAPAGIESGPVRGNRAAGSAGKCTRIGMTRSKLPGAGPAQKFA
jgi:hypothetical protein